MMDDKVDGSMLHDMSVQMYLLSKEGGLWTSKDNQTVHL